MTSSGPASSAYSTSSLKLSPHHLSWRPIAGFDPTCVTRNVPSPKRTCPRTFTVTAVSPGSVLAGQTASRRPRGLRLPDLVGAHAGHHQGLPGQSSVKCVVFDEVEGARGNPLRIRLPLLRRITVLTVTTTIEEA